jgi:hypothetical protein
MPSLGGEEEHSHGTAREQARLARAWARLTGLRFLRCSIAIRARPIVTGTGDAWAEDVGHAASSERRRRRRAHRLVPVAGRPGLPRSRFEALARCEMMRGNPVTLLS